MMETVKQSDEEYVRGVWARVWREDQRHPHESPNKWHGYIILGREISEEMIGSGTRAEAWAAAAEYTREQLEQVRQLREEIAMVNAYISFREKTLESGYTPVSFAEHVAEHLACFRRILTRLESILADKLTGMKAGGA